MSQNKTDEWRDHSSLRLAALPKYSRCGQRHHLGKSRVSRTFVRIVSSIGVLDVLAIRTVGRSARRSTAPAVTYRLIGDA